MITVVVRGDTQKREAWKLYIVDSYGDPRLYLGAYRTETKGPRQRKWRVQEEWDRYDLRSKALPPLPDDVVEEAKEYFVAQIRALVVQPLEK